MLPLPKNMSTILVAGAQANNLGYQCGGWTMTWQGGSGNTTVGMYLLSASFNFIFILFIVYFFCL